MVANPTSRIRRTAQNTQLTYNLSARIHAAQTHPILSPQGATILLYGHDNGVTILWRGGRRFKDASTKKSESLPPKEKRNGTSDDAVMILDDSDEEPSRKVKGQSSAPFVDAPSFADSIDEGTLPEIVQTLELSLGTAALHIAVLPITPSAAEDASVDFLKEKLVFAVSSATGEIFIITLPLTPPSPESKARLELRGDLLAARPGTGKWGESVVVLGGQTKLADGVAMTLVRPKTSATSERLKDQTGIASKPRVIVAAHTREASGVLRLWDVALDNSPPGTAEGSLKAFQTEYLPTPLTRISFNPSHTTQLLAVCSPHATRIYDYAVPSIPDDDPASNSPFPTQGSWQLSLYPPFARPSSTRKPILDAAWIAHGRAILALFADGMWGIWDIDGASPGGATILGKNSSGIRGAALTAFSVSGYVDGISPLRSVGGSVGSASKSRASGSGLEPMTPHTRRDAASSFANPSATPERLATVRGGISVVSLPGSSSSASPASTEESAVLWVGGLDHVCVIPGVLRFWDAQLRKGAGGGVNLFSGAAPTRMLRLHDLNTGLLGERCTGVGAVVNFSKLGTPSSPSELSSPSGGLPIEVLVQGESRLVFVREADDSPGTKIGGVVFSSHTKRRFVSGKNGDGTLVLHRQSVERPNSRFDLSVHRAGSLRAPRGTTEDLANDATMEVTLPTRPRLGFEFEEALGRAADDMDDAGDFRDVEVEMLDLMEIDRALENMEDDRGSGRKRVIFE